VAWFDVIAAGTSCPARSRPGYFHVRARRLGLAAAACLAIEDSRAGWRRRARGLTTVITVIAATRHHDFTGAAIVLSDLGEPGHGFEVLAGDAAGATFVDLALLRRIHSGK
jgi:beta-phosphoglucomutase-like phosphatase (HAD superfamily)